MIALSGRNLVVSECGDYPPEGSGRLMATCADGIHVKNLRGALTIEGCRLEQMGDDSINFHVTGLYVEQVVSPRELVLNGLGFAGLVMPGDSLQVIDQQAGLRGESTVADLEALDGGRRYRVTLDPPVEGVRAGTDREADLVFSVTGCPNPFEVRGCYLASQTEILARGVHGVIAENTLVSTTTNKPAITMGYSGFPWFEGPIPRDIAITDNTFRGTRIAQMLLDGQRGDGIRNLRITGNRFQDITSPMLWARGVTGVVCEDNTIENGPSAFRSRGYTCLWLDDARDVVVDRLEVRDASPLVGAVVGLGKGVAPGDAGVRIGSIGADIDPGVPVVRDGRTGGGLP